MKLVLFLTILCFSISAIAGDKDDAKLAEILAQETQNRQIEDIVQWTKIRKRMDINIVTYSMELEKLKAQDNENKEILSQTQQATKDVTDLAERKWIAAKNNYFFTQKKLGEIDTSIRNNTTTLLPANPLWVTEQNEKKAHLRTQLEQLLQTMNQAELEYNNAKRTMDEQVEKRSVGKEGQVFKSRAEIEENIKMDILYINQVASNIADVVVDAKTGRTVKDDQAACILRFQTLLGKKANQAPIATQQQPLKPQQKPTTIISFKDGTKIEVDSYIDAGNILSVKQNGKFKVIQKADVISIDQKD